MRSPLSILRVRWIRRALYSGVASALSFGTWLFAEELCRASNAVRTTCGLVPVPLYWIGAGAALLLAGWALYSFWLVAPESDT